MARYRLALGSGLVALVALGGPARSLAAQSNRVQRMDPNAKRVLVVTFAGPDKTLGVQAGEALRDRLTKDIPIKQLWPIVKEEIATNLEGAGFKYEDALNTNDAKLLGGQLRADVFVQGSVINQGGTIRVTPWMHSVADARMRQALPVRTGRRVDHAMVEVSRDFKEAWKQWDEEQKCEKLVREGALATADGVKRQKFQEAAAAARTAIALYPPAALARICLASAMQSTAASPDEILPIVNEVLKLDSTNYHALAIGANAYKAKGDTAKYIELLITLLATEPTNVKLQTQVVEELAASRRFAIAIPIIDRALAASPGDPDLIRLRFKLLVVTEEWKEAIKSGEELLRTDTSATDTTFFINLASAYSRDSQPQRAAETTARGLGKYPNYAKLWLIYSQHLRAAGQPAESIKAARRALELDPRMAEATVAYLTIVAIYIDQSQFDSVAPILRSAAAAAPTAQDSAKLAASALQQGQRAFAAARADTATGRELQSRASFDESIRWFALSDSLSPSPQAKFQQGYSAAMVGQQVATKEYQQYEKTLSQADKCTLGRLGQAYATQAQIKVQQGGSFNPTAAGEILTKVVLPLSTFFDALVKKECK